MRDVATPEGYFRLEDAARLGNVSEKTIRNWADQKRIGKRKVKGVVFYSEADIRLQAARQAEAVPETREVIVKQRENQDKLAAFLEAMMSRLEALPRAIAAPAEQPHLITIKHAVRLGYSRPWLKERIAAGELHWFGRKLSRFELEALVQPVKREEEQAHSIRHSTENVPSLERYGSEKV